MTYSSQDRIRMIEYKWSRLHAVMTCPVQDHIERWVDQQAPANEIRAGAANGYYVPREAAEHLCAQIRAEVSRQWLDKQKWSCWRCMRAAQNGVPAGLVTATDNRYRCKAIARRFGHAVL